MIITLNILFRKGNDNMKKNIEDITFDDSLLEKYKEENEKITMLCKKLDKNKKLQKQYNEYLKTKENELSEINYLEKGEYNSVKEELYNERLIEKEIFSFKLNFKEQKSINNFNYKEGLS